MGTADPAWISWAEDYLGTGTPTFSQTRIELAHSQTTTTTLDQMQSLVSGNGPYDESWNQSAETAMGEGGQTLDWARGQLFSAQPAQVAISGFIRQELGSATDALTSSATTAYRNLAAGYTSISNDTADHIKTLASQFSIAATNAGNFLNSVQPTTPQGWAELAAGLAVTGAITVAAAPELAAAGAAVAGTDLLAAMFDTEIAGLTLETRAAVSVLPETAQTSLDELATFTPRQAGATLQLDESTTVTQVEGGPGKGALIFEGGNLAAIQNYFRQITGFTGDFSEALSSNAPAGSTIYSVEMPNGENAVLRDIASSIGDWTIDLPKGSNLANKINEIKFIGVK